MTPLENILDRVEHREKRSDGSYMLKCPSHDDGTASLHATEKSDGSVLLKCHAGCDVGDVLRALNMGLRDLFPVNDLAPGDKPKRDKSDKGKIVETYEYRDADGRLEFKTHRKEYSNGDKSFLQSRPDGHGGWIWNREGTKNIPYRLCDVLAAGPDQPVFIVEGERKADYLAKWGLVATCSAGGAGKWMADHSTHLTGRDVVLLPDNDQPGRDHVAKAIETLQPVARSIKVVTLPDLPNKGDIVDWIDAGHSKDEFLALVATANQDQPQLTATVTQAPPWMWAGDLIDTYPEMRPPVFDGLLRQGETMNAIAAPKTGKSWLSLGMAFSVCMGRDWLDTFPTTAGKVLLVDNELHAETISKRLRDVAAAMNLKRADYQDRIAVKALRGQLQDLHQLSEDLRKCPKGEFTLIVLDAWYRLQPRGSDENANADVTRLYDLLDSVSHQIGSAFVAIHHTSKGSQGEKAVTDTGSGAGSMSRAADTHLVLREHEFPDAIVVDAAVRSFPKITPFVIQRMHPLWVRAEHLDPADIKVANRRNGATGTSQKNKAEANAEREQAARLRLLEAYALSATGDTESSLAATAGMNTANFKPVQSELRQAGHIEPCKIQKHGRTYDGFKITDAGLTALRQLRQLRQTAVGVGVSDSDHTDSDKPPYVVGGCQSESECESLVPSLDDYPADMIDGDYR